MLRPLGIGIAVVLGLLLLGVLLLQTDFGRSQVRNLAVAQIQKLLTEGSVVRVERLRGNVLRGALLTGVEFEQDGETTITVDSLVLNYNLLTLLRRTFSADRVDIIGPTLYARQRPDSTFNLQHLFVPSDPDEDSTGTAFTIRIDSLYIRRGVAEVRFLPLERDSTLRIEELNLWASGFHSGPDSLAGRLNRLVARAIAPHDSARVDITASGELSRDAMALDVLRLNSEAGTSVYGSARLAFLGGDLPDLTADLITAPLAMADVRAFSNIELYGNPRVRLTARSDGDRLTFAVQGAPHEGATVSLDGSLENADQLRYRIEGQLRGLNPAEFTHNESHAASLNGDLRIDLTGGSARTMNGPFEVSLTDSRIGDQPIDHLQVDGAFRTGRLEFALDADVPGARLHAEGDARPFDETPIFDISGEADDVNLARLLRDPNQSTSFSGSFSINGVGIDPETMMAEAIVDLRNVRFGEISLDYLDGVAEIRQGLVRFIAESNLANGIGRIEATGEVRPFGEVLTYRVTDGRASHINMAALTGNPAQESDLSGTFTLDGRGTDLSAAFADFSVSLEPSRFGDYDIIAANVGGALERGIVSFDGSADLGRVGSTEFTGTARPFDSVISYDVDGRVDHLDLAELTRNPARPSDISAAFTARGSGLDLGTLSLDATLELDYSSYGAQEVTGGHLTLRLVQGDLTLDGSLETPEGTFALDASGRPFDQNPTLTFGERMCFGGIDLATLTGNPELRTRLNGCFRGSINGFDLATLSADGHITLQPSTFNDAEIESGSIDLSVREGFVVADVALALVDGADLESSLVLHFNGRPFDATPTYATNGSLAHVDLAAIAGLEVGQPAPLTLDFELEGAGLAFETMALRGRIAAGRSKLGAATLDTLQARFSLDRGRLVLDTLLLRSDLADMEGGGRITLTDQAGSDYSDLTINATLYDLSPLNSYTAKPLALAEGELNVEITGEPGEPLSLDTRLSVQRFAYGSTALSALTSHLSGTFDPTTGALNLRNRLEFKFLSQPALLVERGSVDMTYDAAEMTMEGDIRIDRRRSFDFLSRFEFGQQEQAAMIERLNLNLDDDRWTLARPARISIGEGYRFENLLLQSEDGSQQIAADGVIDPQGEQAFIFTMEEFQAESVADLFGYEGLGGRLSTTLLMTGSAQNPEISGTASLQDFTADGETVGSIDVGLEYASARLDLDARLNHVSGKALTAQGHLPLRFSLADVGAGDVPSITEAAGAEDVEFTILADSFQVGWIEPFLNPRTYSEVGGILNAEVNVAGTQADPQLDGWARLTQGRLGIVSTGRVFETLTASLRLIGNQAVIERAILNDPDNGDTELTIEGAVTLPRLSIGELDLTLRPNDLLAMDTRTYEGLVLDGGPDPIRLTGTLTNPVLRGSAVLSPADINMTEELAGRQFEDVHLSAADLRLIESRFGRRITASDTSVSRFMKNLDLNVVVEIGPDVWLRSSSGLPFAVEFAGRVRAEKPPLAAQTSLYGTVDVTRGWVETLSRRFEIERGTLIFSGLMEETLVDLVATLDIRTDASVGTTGVEISLLVEGRLGDDLSVTLSSTPQLDNADIVSLIATGRLAEDFIGGGALAGATISLGLSQLSGLVEGLTGNALGLDVIQIDQEPGGLVIRLGKYLTSKAFVSVGQPINTSQDNLQRENAPEITLDYALLRWLLLQLEYQNGLGGGLIFEYAY